jgi:hypothetical protein
VTDGNRFTRETWRTGKKSRLRKRTKPWGGQKTAPMAFLEAAKQTQFRAGRSGCRLCSSLKRDGSPCRRLALREFVVCEAHGGVLALARQGKLQSSGRTAAFKATRGRRSRRPIATSSVGIDTFTGLPRRQWLDTHADGEGLGNACLGWAGAANSTPRYLGLG